MHLAPSLIFLGCANSPVASSPNMIILNFFKKVDYFRIFFEKYDYLKKNQGSIFKLFLFSGVASSMRWFSSINTPSLFHTFSTHPLHLHIHNDHFLIIFSSIPMASLNNIQANFDLEQQSSTITTIEIETKYFDYSKKAQWLQAATASTLSFFYWQLFLITVIIRWDLVYLVLI